MFSISKLPIDPNQLKTALTSHSAGACVTFEGIIRNHNDNRPVTALEYEVFDELCVSEGEKILKEARDQFPIILASCVHRSGKLQIGDLAVWVGVSAGHRDEAFAACRYIIDEIKKRLPIWKKEYYADGESGWVNCHVISRSIGKG